MSDLNTLESYGELCADLKSYRAVEKRAEAMGWQHFEPAAGSPQAEYGEPKNRGFRNVLAKRAFYRSIDGHSAYLFLMLAKERDSIGSGVHCAMHLPSTVALPSPKTVATFMGLSLEEVDSAFSSYHSVQGYAFFPGLGKSNEQTNIDLVGEDSLFAKEGIGLKIWSIDKQGNF